MRSKKIAVFAKGTLKLAFSSFASFSGTD